MNAKFARIFLVIVMIGSASIGAARDIVLRAKDGSLELSGTLLSFDGENYRVRSKFGDISVASAEVECISEFCPHADGHAPEFRLTGAPLISRVLVPALIEGFARTENYTSTRQEVDANQLILALSDTKDDALIARFVITSSDSADGYAGLTLGDTNIALTTRAPLETETLIETTDGPLSAWDAFNATVVALDALVPVLGMTPPSHTIDLANLETLFAGQDPSWRAITETGDSDTHETAMRFGIWSQDTPPASLTHQDVLTKLKSQKAGIAMIPFSQASTFELAHFSGPCGAKLFPNRQSIKSEDYPFAMPLFLVTRNERLHPILRSFFRYLKGRSAQGVVRRAGFIDQSPEEIALAVQGNRLSQAILKLGDGGNTQDLQTIVQELSSHNRLTYAFRFDTGSSDMDAQSHSYIRHLAHAINEGSYDGRTLIFAGFSDGEGPASTNKEIAKERATAVVEIISKRLTIDARKSVKLVTRGFGEAIPLACDDTEWGKRANRRVEVWVSTPNSR